MPGMASGLMGLRVLRSGDRGSTERIGSFWMHQIRPHRRRMCPNRLGERGIDGVN